MKPHLPFGLRKAVLAALFLSSVCLSQAYGATASLTHNQHAVLHALQATETDSPAGALEEVIEAMQHTGDAQGVKDGLENLSGNAYTTLMTGLLAGSQNHTRSLRSMIGHMPANVVPTDGKSDSIAYSDSIWFAPFVNSNKVGGDGNAPGFTRYGWGGVLGAEHRATDGDIMGIAAGYEHHRNSVHNGRIHGNTYYIDLYLAQRLTKHWHHCATLGVGLHDFYMKRGITIGGDSPFAAGCKSDTNATTLNLGYELAYDMELSQQSSFTPFFTMDSSWAWLDGFSESGAGNAGLHVKSEDAWGIVFGLGTRYTQEFELMPNSRSATFTAEAMLLLDAGDQGKSMNAAFLGSPHNRFRLQEADYGRVGCLIGAGLTIPVRERWTAFGSAGYEFRESLRTFNANMGLSYSF